MPAPPTSPGDGASVPHRLHMCRCRSAPGWACPGHAPSPRLAATDTPAQPSSSGGRTPSRSSHRSNSREGAAAGALARPGAAQSPVPAPALPATSRVPRCTTSATGLGSAWLPGPSSSRELLSFQLIMSHGLAQKGQISRQNENVLAELRRENTE